MIRFKILFAIFLASVSVNELNGQNKASDILKAVYNKLQKARDYSVQAKIRIDMPFIRILPVNATIYFKQKGKFKIKSRGVAVVPRQGFDQVSKILADSISYTAMVQGSETTGSKLSTIVNIIPLADTLDLILGRLWIDPIQNVILKSQLTTKSNGTIETEYAYRSQIEYGLPDSMIFYVDVKRFKMPKNIPAESTKNNNGSIENSKTSKKGRIIISLTKYLVNKGIPDNIFF
jgi:hypothetical protein